ncbi:MAG: ABC transporter permease [Oscillospiraceae bacterium]|nr:ABC transporter permease [Oscillospiraceae bacterium]
MFETLLAKRYIFSQKRHSVLTICSIAIALALMTMLFTSLSTVIGCLRDIAYDNGHYHLKISISDSEEEAEAIEKYISGYGTCSVEEYDDGKYVLIMFDNYIGDRDEFMDALFGSMGKTPAYDTNYDLIHLDMIDLDARVYMVQIFAMFYIFVLFFIMALRMIIDTAFEVSSKERERQFGVLQSIGAAPGQIVGIITFEGLILSIIGIPIGVGLGIGLGYAAYQAVLGSGFVEAYFTPAKAAELLHFHVNPWLILLGTVTGLVWVLLSAYGTGMRIIKMSPIQAISARSNTVKKVKKHSLFGLLFGWTGKLASRNNSRQPERFLITVLALTLSMTLFASFSIVIDRVQYNFVAELAEHSYFGTVKDLGIAIYESYEAEDIKRAALDFDPLYYRDGLRAVEESDYFRNVDYSIRKFGKLYADETGFKQFNIQYYCRDSYDRIFNGEPPISYDDLTAQGGYILLTDPQHRSDLAEEFVGMDSIPLAIAKQRNLTVEEYDALTPEEQELAGEHGYLDAETGRSVLYYYIRDEITGNIPINCSAEAYGVYPTEWADSTIAYLAGTIGEYENGEYQLYGADTLLMERMIGCDLTDREQYEEALDFLEKNKYIYLTTDNYAEYRKIESTFAALRVGMAFLIIMIALIAVVNMVNILSTGILNRRGELAAMQCVGMTEKQLYKMTVIECLQYVLSAGIMSVILCELIMYCTHEFMKSMGLLESMSLLNDTFGLGEYILSKNMSDVISYLAPLPKIGLAMIPAFAAALLASVIPLRRMQKASLVEQIQSVD